VEETLGPFIQVYHNYLQVALGEKRNTSERRQKLNLRKGGGGGLGDYTFSFLQKEERGEGRLRPISN